MTGAEAAVALGGAVVKSAVKVWLGDREVAADTAANAIDLLSSRATDYLQRRRISRTFEQMVDVVAERLSRYVSVEFRGLPENEMIATLDAVRDTFEGAALTDEEIFASDLNAAYLDRYLRRQVPNVPERAALATSARPLYDLLMRECSEY